MSVARVAKCEMRGEAYPLGIGDTLSYSLTIFIPGENRPVHFRMQAFVSSLAKAMSSLGRKFNVSLMFRVQLVDGCLSLPFSFYFKLHIDHQNWQIEKAEKKLKRKQVEKILVFLPILPPFLGCFLSENILHSVFFPFYP